MYELINYMLATTYLTYASGHNKDKYFATEAKQYCCLKYKKQKFLQFIYEQNSCGLTFLKKNLLNKSLYTSSWNYCLKNTLILWNFKKVKNSIEQTEFFNAKATKCIALFFCTGATLFVAAATPEQLSYAVAI